ncbi:tyrosine-type recombinase/integrase [Streptomyces scabiei]|uniref:tyrosine-type recombinase/integrase n=1 Tax=Streptomyces scabiei TaxID=1930 RepID=UPI0036AB2317
MARRNANGEGSIYRRKDRGGWVGSVWVQTTSGKPKRVYVYGVTRAEVHEKLIERKAQDAQGILTSDKNWKLGEYLDYWLAEVVEPNLKPTTYDLYESNIRRYLKPGLGDLPLTKLTVPMLQSYLNQQLAAGRSVRKVQTLREIVSSALTRAMREEKITRNVAQLVTVKETYGAGEEVWPWSAEESRRFLEVAQKHKWFPAFLISLLDGVRRGEVLGLRKKDIDFTRQLIYVRQQVFRARGKVQIGPVKTKAGVRSLPLIDVVADVLKQHLARQADLSDDSLIFTSSTGTPIEPQNYTRAFLTICARNGLRRITLHGLRHGAATLLKELHVPDKDIQLILGHSNVSVTQKIYQHVRMESRRDALDRATEAILPSSKDVDAGAGSCQNGCQELRYPSLVQAFDAESDAKNKPATGVPVAGWLNDFLGDLTENRTPIARMKTRNTTGWGGTQQRVTEVDGVLRVRRRSWLLGVVAVSAAVKDTRGEEADLAA